MSHTQQLLHASEEGNLSVVQGILDKGADVNSAAEDEQVTPLQVAAANGQEHIVRLLLMRGATLDKANSFGWTPLLLAARHGHVNVVALLLQNQADLNAKTKLGANALILAARGGHLQTCKLLIEAGIEFQTSTPGIGGSCCEYTPLMVGAHHGHDAVARLLLDRGCDVNHRTPSMGVNALMLTALNGYMTTSQILIERGADPNLTNVNEHTPLQVSTIRGKREVQGYLDRKTTNKRIVAKKDVKPDIIDAARSGDIERIREILDDDQTQRDASSPQDGATPLMFAAMTGRLDIAQLLVERGCDLNKQDTVSGWTALMQATYHGKKVVAKFIITAGADVLIPAKNGCSAFDLASLIDDMDTELYRLMAAKAVKVTGSDKKPWGLKPGKQNGALRASTSMLHDGAVHDKPKSGLKAWWNRMSNRFRNLKMNRSSNRLAPMPSPEPPPGNSDTLRSNASTAQQGTLPSSSPESPPARHSLTTGPLSQSSHNLVSLSSYDTIMLETKKSASVYTLGINSASANLQDGNLKPVIPPFLPPPTFEPDRPRMPPTTSRRSVSSLGSSSTLTQPSTRPIIPPMKLLQSYSVSSQNLASPTSPGPNVKFGQDQQYFRSVSQPKADPPAAHKFSSVTSPPGSGSDQSPSSSAGASGISGTTAGGRSQGGPSSASSSTLTAGSDNLNRSGGCVGVCVCVWGGVVGRSQGGPSSASSSTLTAGSDNLNRSGNDPLFTPVSRVHRPPSFPSSASYHRHHVAFSVHSYTSPSSSSTGASSILMPNKQARAKSQSSSRDTASTLTPSPSPVPKAAETNSEKSSTNQLSVSNNNKLPDVEETDPGGILKTLSLERYQPIFEEQEVDMEAFLTLTDQDLTELGICHTDSRRQILTAITELNDGKGRERQRLQDTITSYQSSQGAFPDGGEYADWSLTRDGSQPANHSTKSRSS